MIANVGYTNGYFEIWGAGNYASYGGNQISNTEKYYPDSTNFRIFWDGNMYDELLDGTSGSDEGGSLKISGKSGRIQTLNNVISNNGTKNNACPVPLLLFLHANLQTCQRQDTHYFLCRCLK